MYRTKSHSIVSSVKRGMAVFTLCAFAIPVFADVAGTQQSRSLSAQNGLSPATVEKIRKGLVTLPSYGVFDDLTFQTQGPVVTLKGYASRPILKSDAERVVASVEGVQSVVNKIEVLPVSQMDDVIRLKTYLAIYRNPSLQRYATGSGFMPRLTPLWAAGGITNNPPTGWQPIHIIVKNGNVTLTGFVGREMDKTIAGMAANRVSGVFRVNNDRVVAADAKPDKAARAES